MADAIPVPVEEYDAWKRFMAKVDQDGDIPACAPHLGPCWVWKGAKFKQGYGVFVLAGKRRRAHRVLYVWENGEPGLPLDHDCQNRACVNPAHLTPRTAGENVLRGEGVTARNAVKTHCARGHEFTDENTYINPRGERQCRTCMRAAVDRYQDANRDAYLRRRRERREPVVHAERECAHPECSERFVPIRATGVFCKTPECVRRRVRERRGLS